METPPLPLLLTLSPVLPLRAPEPGALTLTFGYQLRLPRGPALAADDALLCAFGAVVVELVCGGEDHETLQDGAFAPGRQLLLLEEGVDDDGDPVVGAWDAERVRRAGALPYRTAAVVAAAAEQRLAMEAVVLTEDRVRRDDRRVGLRVLVYAPALVRVDVEAAAAPAVRRAPDPRERVVLVADGSGVLRWWDPSGRSGPMGIHELPLSSELVADLERLSAAYAGVGDDDTPPDAVHAIEHDMYRASLEGRTRQLWRRARAELGRRYAIGLLGPGMTRPAWATCEDDDDDEDTAF